MDYSLINQAKLEDGKVYIFQGDAWIVCPDAKAQTMGEANSTGIVIIGAMGAVYFSSIQLDISYTLRTLSEALGKVVEITRAQYVINADNAVFGQITELSGIGDSIAGIKTQIDEHKLI